MDLGYAVIKGVIQGLTEFLPVSSTAHLVFMDALAEQLQWAGRPASPQEAEFFNILVQTGTLGAVVYFFRKELFQTLQLMRKKPCAEPPDPLFEKTMPLAQMPKFLIISSVLTAAFVLLMLKGSEAWFMFTNMPNTGIMDISELFFVFPETAGLHLALVGFLIVAAEMVSEKMANEAASKEATPDAAWPKVFSLKHAVSMGLMQGVSAIFHGMSRSGTTISTGLFGGLDRTTATRYSFMLSIPAFIMATGYDALKFMKSGHLGHFSWFPMIVGTGIAGLVGYFCVKYFIQFVATNRLTGFAIYCVVAGMLAFLYLSQTGYAK